jgi:hypothetical protein
MSENTTVYRDVRDAAQAFSLDEPIEVAKNVFDYYLEVMAPAHMGETVLIGHTRREIAFSYNQGRRSVIFWIDTSGEETRYFAQQVYTEVLK